MLLSVFLTFLKVGATSFGGGYGMIALLQEEVLSHGWLTEDEFLSFIAVSESTPGPIAINMSTFVGSSQGGLLGALLATLGVVLPSFLIILAVAALFKNLLRYAGVQAALSGIRPVVAGLITGTALTTLFSTLSVKNETGALTGFDWRALVIFLLVALTAFLWKKWRKKKISPILLIVFSAALGIAFYGIFPV